MTVYISVGACVNGSRPATKKVLREALADPAHRVRFDNTAAAWFPSESSWDPAGDNLADLPVGVVLSVTGPDPYTDRRWYASVTRLANGKIKVS